MDYYERYWNKDLGKEGLANVPPNWQAADLKRIMDVIEPYCQGRVLDLGCGEGTFTHHLQKLSRVKEVVGADISQIAILKARQKYPRIEFEVIEENNLPFPAESFDFVSAVEIIEHIIDTEGLLKGAGGRKLNPATILVPFKNSRTLTDALKGFRAKQKPLNVWLSGNF